MLWIDRSLGRGVLFVLILSSTQADVMEIQLRGNFELFTCTSELWMCTQNVFELEIEQGGVKSRSENTRNRMLHETVLRPLEFKEQRYLFFKAGRHTYNLLPSSPLWSWSR